MAGARLEQAILTRDTDMTKTEETRRVIENMVDGLNDHRIADIGEFFADSFRWIGNQGCGKKKRTARLSGKLAKTVPSDIF